MAGYGDWFQKSNEDGGVGCISYPIPLPGPDPNMDLCQQLTDRSCWD